MEKKKFVVYYNDEVNEPAEVFSANTLTECEDWIEDHVEGKTPVYYEYPFTDDGLSSNVFSYEVYEGEMITEINGQAVFNDWCFASDYYYRD